MQNDPEQPLGGIAYIPAHRDEYILRPGEPKKKRWPLRTKQAFIETIFSREGMTPLTATIEGDKTRIIDGVERILAIYEFADNQFKTFTIEQGAHMHYAVHPHTAGLFFDELPEGYRQQFLKYGLPFFIEHLPQ